MLLHTTDDLGMLLTACVLAALVTSSQSMLWQYCLLCAGWSWVVCTDHLAGNQRREGKWRKCDDSSSVGLKVYKT